MVEIFGFFISIPFSPSRTIGSLSFKSFKRFLTPTKVGIESDLATIAK